MKLWHEGIWLLAFNIKKPFRKYCKQPRHLSMYFLRFGFCQKEMLFTHVFFMSVNANFAGELLGKFQLSYSLEFSMSSASLLIHFPPISLH